MSPAQAPLISSRQWWAPQPASVGFALVQEVTRLGGHFGHVHDEAIDPKHDEPAGEAWIQGRFGYMLYRRQPESR
jgi:hypothetical protein